MHVLSCSSIPGDMRHVMSENISNLKMEKTISLDELMKIITVWPFLTLLIFCCCFKCILKYCFTSYKLNFKASFFCFCFLLISSECDSLFNEMLYLI